MRGREKITLKFMAFTTGESRAAHPCISLSLSISFSLFRSRSLCVSYTLIWPFLFLQFMSLRAVQVKPKEAENLPPPTTPSPLAPPPPLPSSREFFTAASDIRK